MRSPDSEFNDRIAIADTTLPSDERTTARWFNTAAFTQAPQFTIGNSSRNPVVGPDYRVMDVMVGKTFPIREQIRAEFRAEAFNVTNTPPLAAPNTVSATPRLEPSPERWIPACLKWC